VIVARDGQISDKKAQLYNWLVLIVLIILLLSVLRRHGVPEAAMLTLACSWLILWIVGTVLIILL
jgi:hypothetical protein